MQPNSEAFVRPLDQSRVDSLASLIDCCYKKFLEYSEKNQPMSEQQIISMLEMLSDASGKLQHLRYSDASSVEWGTYIYLQTIKNL